MATGYSWDKSLPRLERPSGAPNSRAALGLNGTLQVPDELLAKVDDRDTPGIVHGRDVTRVERVQVGRWGPTWTS
ncbi:hypothetical protein [Streptomyces sp. LN500]|uniref:hypothetical protein n=1 Tax=Streptomyces sp. LN500 TaxID=3112978 RepID=UPI003713E654